MIDLGSAPLFSSLSSVELARLVGELEEQSFPAGTVIIRRGDPGDCMYVVRSGVAEARAGTPDDLGYPLAIFEPGDSFGEMALLTDAPRSTTVSALTNLSVWALPKERFQSLVKSTPELAVALGRMLSTRLQATNQAVSSVHRAFDAAAERAYRELEPNLQEFLQRISPLDPISVPLADRALGRADSERVLADLSQQLPFVVQEWPGLYRLHPLFRELLVDKLAATLGETAERDWLSHLAEIADDLAQPEQAIALLVAAETPTRAIDLACRRARALLDEGRAEDAEQLLSSLPPLAGQPYAELLEMRSELAAGRGENDRAVALLEEANRLEDDPSTSSEPVRQAARYRRLAELSFQLGRGGEGLRWLRQAGETEGLDQQALADLEQLVPRNGLAAAAAHGGLLALASLTGLRRTSSSAGALGGSGASRPLGIALAVAVLLWFLLSPPPSGLLRAAYEALGVLAAALPLLIFSVLEDHLVTLLMAVGWAGLGLVPARVALSGFATPGWFLVLSVLAVGVALAKSGLLYRLVLLLLERVPSSHVLLTLALAGAGLIFSPAMPNATARTALAAPLVLELSDALGYAHRSRGSAAIAMAALLGFGQMCSLFLTGSSSGLLVYSLLPPESRATFGFVGWFIAALPLHVVIFVITYVGALLVLRPERSATRSRGKIQAQQRVLGPVSRDEAVAAGVFVILLAAFVLGPLIGLEPAWSGVLAMVVLGAAGVLDQKSFRNGVNWSFLIFFGVMLSLADVFSTLKVDSWLAAAAATPLTPLAARPVLFLLAVGVAGYLLNFVVRWQAACVLMTLVLVPAVAPLGVEPWVVGMATLVTTNMWFLPYQSTIYQALYYGTDEKAFSHAQARPIALIYGVACLVGLAASVPVWQAMGLLPR